MTINARGFSWQRGVSEFPWHMAAVPPSLGVYDLRIYLKVHLGFGPGTSDRQYA